MVKDLLPSTAISIPPLLISFLTLSLFEDNADYNNNNNQYNDTNSGTNDYTNITLTTRIRLVNMAYWLCWWKIEYVSHPIRLTWLYWTAPDLWAKNIILTLSLIQMHLKVSAVEDFWNNCYKWRKCAFWHNVSSLFNNYAFIYKMFFDKRSSK